MKTCSSTSCSQQNPQPINNFYSDKRSSDGKRSQCKKCTLKIKQIYYAKNPQCHLDKLKAWKRANPDRVREGNLRNNYGITLAEFDAMLKSQNNCCALCGTTEPGGNNNHFCVDHSHKTGKIRSLLCFTCNIALGMLKDRPELINNVANYLVKHGETF